MRAMRSVPSSLLVLALLLAGCPKEVPPVDLAAADAGHTPADVAGRDVERLEAEVATVVRGVDEALWAHWTTGAPLDLAAATGGHDALFSKATLDRLRHARELRPADGRRIAHLERWLAGELLARGVAAEAEAFANLEATVTFTLNGREVPWRELARLLVSEKSAVRRRALWAASHAAAARLDAALQRVEEKEREVLVGLDFSSTLDFAAEVRELDLDALARDAEALLASTEAEWAEALRALSDEDLRLPTKALTRADLPRLLRVSSSVDADFPMAKVAERLTQTLGALGLHDRAGLTLDLTEAAKKSPLPLTVAPARGGVRLSARPVGGLKDQQALLAELGAAVALHAAKTGAFGTERLGDPAFVQHAGELFALLVSEPAWLEFVGVPVERHAAVLAAARAQRLFGLRRAAGVVLARLETQALEDEAEARGRFVAITARATGLSLAAAEGARRRLETADFLRAASTLKAARAADALRAQLGEKWWATPAGTKALLARLARGTAVPVMIEMEGAAPMAPAPTMTPTTTPTTTTPPTTPPAPTPPSAPGSVD